MLVTHPHIGLRVHSNNCNIELTVVSFREGASLTDVDNVVVLQRWRVGVGGSMRVMTPACLPIPFAALQSLSFHTAPKGAA